MNMLHDNFLLIRFALQLRHRCQLLGEEPHQPGLNDLVARILRPRPHMDTGYLFDDPVRHLVTLSGVAWRVINDGSSTNCSWVLFTTTARESAVRDAVFGNF